MVYIAQVIILAILATEGNYTFELFLNLLPTVRSDLGNGF